MIWITEVEDGKSVKRLGSEADKQYVPKDDFTEASVENVTLDDLTEYCDLEAEGANYHSFVGVHGKLAELIKSNSSEEVAKAVMFEIADCGGLHEFNS